MVTISVAQMRDIKADSELFENAEPSLIKKYDKCMGETSYLVYYLIAAIFFTKVLVFSDMILGDIGILSFVVTLVSGYWILKGKYVAWITGNKKVSEGIVLVFSNLYTVFSYLYIKICL